MNPEKPTIIETSRESIPKYHESEPVTLKNIEEQAIMLLTRKNILENKIDSITDAGTKEKFKARLDGQANKLATRIGFYKKALILALAMAAAPAFAADENTSTNTLAPSVNAEQLAVLTNFEINIQEPEAEIKYTTAEDKELSNFTDALQKIIPAVINLQNANDAGQVLDAGAVIVKAAAGASIDSFALRADTLQNENATTQEKIEAGSSLGKYLPGFLGKAAGLIEQATKTKKEIESTKEMSGRDIAEKVGRFLLNLKTFGYGDKIIDFLSKKA